MKTSGKPFYLTKLRQELDRRQKKNPALSLRSFANSLSINSSTLSAVLSEKRIPSQKVAKEMAEKICGSEKERQQFISSTQGGKILKQLMINKSPDSEITLAASQQHILGEWEHFAILTLCEVADFSSDPIWISKRLGIALARVRKVLKNLEEASIIKYSRDGEIQINRQKGLADAEPVTLKKASRQSMELGIEKLATESTAHCYFSSITFSLSDSQVEEAQVLIREFRQRFVNVFNKEKKKHVFKFNLQLFPLTHMTDGADNS